MRPVCGATESANGALSELLTEILTVVGDKADKDGFNCLSNEELMAALTEVNQKNMLEPVILSMDVVSMFPNLNVDRVAEVDPWTGQHRAKAETSKGKSSFDINRGNP